LKFAILIDAGFLKRKLGSQSFPLSAGAVLAFIDAIRKHAVLESIGLDIAALTLKAHVSVIVLVTGDSDFVPAMKFARREGAQVLLVTLGHPIRSDMLEHSDLVLELPDAATRAA
jgi:uncharacterized LabA/DUF88 family protein